ncbi:MAG: PspC domain-containing protein [Alistipes sp.]|nr:PspC domain-containing protein [Alistipes sp.]
MNEITNCSISGIAFTFDNEAYARLQAYLDSLAAAYADNPDKEEILADIEARIAELILSTQSDSSQSVALPLVENIIAQLGSAEEISDSDDNTPKGAKEARIPRRLYRDMSNSKLGGVCAGLARYFNMDPSIVRLLLFVPLIGSFAGVIPLVGSAIATFSINLFLILILSYVIMWFAVPAAISARQKLEMDGQRSTASAIANHPSATTEQKAKSTLAKVVHFLGRALLIMLKIVVGIIIVPLAITSIGLIIVALAGLFGIFSDLINVGNLGEIGSILGDSGNIFMMMLIALALIPLISTIYLFVMLIIERRPKWWTLAVVFIMWILLLACTLFTGVKCVKDWFSDSTATIETVVNPAIIEQAVTEIREAAEEPAMVVDSTEYKMLVADPTAPSIDQ